MESAHTPPQRIIVDVEQLARFDHHSGIQRVVKNIVATLYKKRQNLYRVIPVRLHDHKLLRWEHILPTVTGESIIQPESEVQAEWHDILLMLDASWDYFDDFREVFARVRHQCGHIYTVVYDLLHSVYPHLTDPQMSVLVSKWLHAVIQNSDGLVCISKVVADDLVTYIQERTIPHADNLKIGYFHLGSDIKAVSSDDSVRPEVSEWFKDGAQVFLIVGWIDLRKGQDFALDAFEKLWNEGVNAKLIFAGKEGWNRREFIDRVLAHPEYAKRLLWVNKPTDAEIIYCYRHAAALLFPSITEGFGLPLIEAAHYGLPIICSDIPVFREIAGDYALYFSRESSHHLTEVLCDWLKQPQHLDSAKMPRLTWEQSAEQLLDVILRNKWYKQYS